jgi:uncharacterized protein (DUF1330 family)
VIALVEPTEETLAELEAIAGGPDDGPCLMLNLHRYRDREAYYRYGAVAARVLERVGGRIAWYAQADSLVIGGPDDDYDEVIAAWYPSLAAFVELARDPEIQTVRADRAAGLERAVLLRLPGGAEPRISPPA